MRGAKTLVIGLAATAAMPAAAGAATRTGSMYHVVQASGTERVTFSADPATCARRLTCGYRGTVTYSFGGAPHGALAVTRDGRGHVSGVADFRSRGTTVSKVTAGLPCTDTIQHRKEHFTIGSHSRLGRLLFQLHGGSTDHLVTDCSGPTENDLEHDDALPQGSFKQHDFDAQTTSIQLKGSSVFRERGYRGTAGWRLKYRLERYRCSPNCTIR